MATRLIGSQFISCLTADEAEEGGGDEQVFNDASCVTQGHPQPKICVLVVSAPPGRSPRPPFAGKGRRTVDVSNWC